MVKEIQLLDEWQARLGLQDWAITLKYNCDLDEMELGEVAGETEWAASIKSGYIKIISQKEYNKMGERVVPYDFENILVHELLHLKFSLIDQKITSYESSVVYEVRHQLIDDIARALILAKRKQITRDVNKRIIDTEELKDYE